MIYFVVFAVFAGLAVLETYGLLGRLRVPLLVAAGGFLVLFAGLKWETGTDWEPYFRFFQLSSPSEPWYTASYEIGYVLWNRLLAAVWANYSFYMVATAALCVGAIMTALRGKAAPTFLVLAVLFANTLVAFSLTRQTIAGALVLLAFATLRDGRRLLFLALVGLAATFHVTALIALVALLLDREIGMVPVTIALAAALALGWLGALRGTLNWFAGVIPEGRIADRIMLYLKSDGTFGQAYPPLRELLGPAKHLVLFSALAWYRFGRLGDDQAYRFFFNIYAVGIAIYMATVNDLAVFQRLFWYFNTAQAFLVPGVIGFERGRRRAVVGVAFFAYYAVLLYFTLRSYWGEYVPYDCVIARTELW